MTEKDGLIEEKGNGVEEAIARNYIEKLIFESVIEYPKDLYTELTSNVKAFETDTSWDEIQFNLEMKETLAHDVDWDSNVIKWPIVRAEVIYGINSILNGDVDNSKRYIRDVILRKGINSGIVQAEKLIVDFVESGFVEGSLEDTDFFAKLYLFVKGSDVSDPNLEGIASKIKNKSSIKDFLYYFKARNGYISSLHGQERLDYLDFLKRRYVG